MATITNQCDVLLQATTPRMLNVSSNFITVTPTTNTFSTTATSTSPSSIIVRASLSGELRGTVSWSTVPTVAFTVVGNILTLPATSVAAGSSVTVTATLTLYGQTYTSSATISHQADTVTSSLSSSAVTVSTNADGSGGVYTSATSTMSVTIGNVNDSANWSYSWSVPTSVTATGVLTSTIAVSALTTDTASLTCTATRIGWATQTKTFTISKSKNGSAGVNGTRTAILDLYQWASSTPTVFPSGTSTYTWSTAQFTSPATLNSWTSIPGTGSAGQTLYIARQIYADSLSTATSSVTWNTTSALPLSSAGTDGVNGTRTAFLEVYRWAATTPTTFPSGTSTYTWATGVFTSPSTSNGWSLTPGAPTPGYTLYGCSVRYADTGTSLTSSVTWNTSTAYVLGAAGTNGTPGSTGNAGITTIIAYQQVSQTSGTPTYSTSTSGNTLPGASWSATAPSVTVGSVVWYSYGRYNSNAVTVDGIAGNTTVWSAPIAASVFQDIKSDNWNGSNPPTYNNTATYGTIGYYIKRNSGDAFFENVVTRGDAQFVGNTITGEKLLVAGGSFDINYTTKAQNLNTGSNTVAVGHYGVADSLFSLRNVGVLGIGKYSSQGMGVVGDGGLIGGYFIGPTALELLASGATNRAINILSNATIRWNNYEIAAPTGSTTTFLRNDGTWATNAMTLAVTNSGTANVSGSGLSLVGSTSTGIAGAYVGTSGSGNTVTWTIQTTSPSDIRLKEEVADIDIGLSFVNNLRPVSYKLKADPKSQKGYGFIADEVQQLGVYGTSLVYEEPNWQVGDEVGFKTIHYPSYIAVLTKAIQELSQESVTLKNQLQTVSDRLAVLESTIK